MLCTRTVRSSWVAAGLSGNRSGILRQPVYCRFAAPLGQAGSENSQLPVSFSVRRTYGGNSGHLDMRPENRGRALSLTRHSKEIHAKLGSVDFPAIALLDQANRASDSGFLHASLNLERIDCDCATENLIVFGVVIRLTKYERAIICILIPPLHIS